MFHKVWSAGRRSRAFVVVPGPPVYYPPPPLHRIHTNIFALLFTPFSTGVERWEAKLCFCWSQMIVADELKRRKRALSLVFFDFVEVRTPYFVAELGCEVGY